MTPRNYCYLSVLALVSVLAACGSSGPGPAEGPPSFGARRLAPRSKAASSRAAASTPIGPPGRFPAIPVPERCRCSGAGLPVPACRA